MLALQVANLRTSSRKITFQANMESSGWLAKMSLFLSIRVEATSTHFRCNWLTQDPPGRCILGSPSGPQGCVKSGLPNLGGRCSAFTLGVVGFAGPKRISVAQSGLPDLGARYSCPSVFLSFSFFSLIRYHIIFHNTLAP